ncbi:MAG: CZB domain-containing protein [Oligoflexia bacterium]|nr:CZB domain-containing protein [Oligoflexia bacterium]
MDFDGAIQAHVDWKLKLRGYIGKPDGALKAAVIEKDNECALGKWLYSEGARFSSLKEFGELKTIHAKFHKCAAEVVRKADAKDAKGAESLLASGSEYASISNQVVVLIRQLRAKAQT